MQLRRIKQHQHIQLELLSFCIFSKNFLYWFNWKKIQHRTNYKRKVLITQRPKYNDRSNQSELNRIRTSIIKIYHSKYILIDVSLQRYFRSNNSLRVVKIGKKTKKPVILFKLQFPKHWTAEHSQSEC